MRNNWDSSGMYSWSPPSWKVKLLVAFCGIVIIAGVGLILHFRSLKSDRVIVGDSDCIHAEITHDKFLRFVDNHGLPLLSISLAGHHLEDNAFSDFRLSNASSNHVCLSWTAHDTTLCISQISSTGFDADVSRFDVTWSFTSSGSADVPEDCMFFGNGVMGQPVWYDTMQYVVWPKLLGSYCEEINHNYAPTAKRAVDIGGTVVEPLWISSQGVALRASLRNHIKTCMKLCRDASLSKLCLKSETQNSKTVSEMSYSVYFEQNLTKLHSHVISSIAKEAEILNNQSAYPPSNTNKSIRERCSPLLHKPLWNIAMSKDGYKDQNSTAKDLEFISKIGGTGFVSGICNVYQRIGDYTLNDDMNMDTFVAAMQKMNLSVMLPTSPFLNYDSQNFKEAVDKGYILENSGEQSPVLINAGSMKCKSAYPGIVDFTNTEASHWFAQKMGDGMKNYTIDFLQLMYGQSSWLPNQYRSRKELSNPGLFSTLYTQTADLISPCPLTDIAYASQNRHQIVLLKPTSGLEETLKMALASGLAGYPLFIPNLPFKLDEVHMLPTTNLTDGFIRWIQLVSFFPVMHIPWDFKVMSDRKLDVELLMGMIQKCLLVRNGDIVGDAIKKALNRAGQDRSLFLSPMWMAPGVPGHSETEYSVERIFLIDNQFMIGRDLIVAPILQMGARHRDMFLPKGVWTRLGDPESEFTSNGRFWLKRVNVPLDEIPIFYRKDI